MMTAINSKVETIRQGIQSSYDELNRLIAGPLLQVDTSKLYHAYATDAWTPMENLAHIAEFMPYWADEIARLVAAPGQNFGRTAQHEGRLSAIREHGSYTLVQAAAALSDGYTHLDQVIRGLQDTDLDITGRHSSFGEQRLEWFIEEFVTKHLTEHIQQIKEGLAASQQGT